jgi:hypothetical protein
MSSLSWFQDDSEDLPSWWVINVPDNIAHGKVMVAKCSHGMYKDFYIALSCPHIHFRGRRRLRVRLTKEIARSVMVHNLEGVVALAGDLGVQVEFPSYDNDNEFFPCGSDSQIASASVPLRLNLSDFTPTLPHPDVAFGGECSPPFCHIDTRGGQRDSQLTLPIELRAQSLSQLLMSQQCDVEEPAEPHSQYEMLSLMLGQSEADSHSRSQPRGSSSGNTGSAKVVLGSKTTGELDSATSEEEFFSIASASSEARNEPLPNVPPDEELLGRKTTGEAQNSDEELLNRVRVIAEAAKEPLPALVGVEGQHSRQSLLGLNSNKSRKRKSAAPNANVRKRRNTKRKSPNGSSANTALSDVASPRRSSRNTASAASSGAVTVTVTDRASSDVASPRRSSRNTASAASSGAVTVAVTDRASSDVASPRRSSRNTASAASSSAVAVTVTDRASSDVASPRRSSRNTASAASSSAVEVTVTDQASSDVASPRRSSRNTASAASSSAVAVTVTDWASSDVASSRRSSRNTALAASVTVTGRTEERDVFHTPHRHEADAEVDECCCYTCGKTPCEWIEFGLPMLGEVQSKFDISTGKTEGYVVELSNGEHIPNKNIRYLSYRLFTYEKFGHLGHGNRVKLPNCVEGKIKEFFPELSGTYTNFQAANDEELSE